MKHTWISPRDMTRLTAENVRLTADRDALVVQIGKAFKALREAMDERDTWRTVADTLATVFQHDTPWPLRSVLERLAHAADHLLTEHSCDVLGYEGIIAARDQARRILPLLDAAHTAYREASR